MNRRKFLSVVAVALMLAMAFTTSAFARNDDKITIKQTHASTAISASESSTSAAVDLGAIKPNGYFSLQVTLSGSGTGKGEYLLSNDGITYLEPSSASDIFTGLTATGGPGSDGADIYSFSPEIARYLKIKITETGGSSSITVTTTLAVQ